MNIVKRTYSSIGLRIIISKSNLFSRFFLSTVVLFSSQVLLRHATSALRLPTPHTSTLSTKLPKVNKTFLNTATCLFSTNTKTHKMSFDAANPLLQEWKHTPHGIPPFTDILPSHFESALQYSMQEHIKEVQGIAANPEEATFDNTIATLDRSGALFSKVCETFENLCSSNGVPELQEVELKMAGPLAAHYNTIATIPGLFARIDAIYQNRQSLQLNSEQIRLVERFHLDFVRAGAKFSPDVQVAYGKIVEELAELSTKFTQVSNIDQLSYFCCCLT